jgi:hypothetical protein
MLTSVSFSSFSHISPQFTTSIVRLFCKLEIIRSPGIIDVTLHYHAESGGYQHSPPALPTRNLGSTRSELLGRKRRLETEEYMTRIVGHSLLCPGFSHRFCWSLFAAGVVSISVNNIHGSAFWDWQETPTPILNDFGFYHFNPRSVPSG